LFQRKNEQINEYFTNIINLYQKIYESFTKSWIEINICEIVMIDKRIKKGKGYRNKFIKELKICLKLWLWVWKLQNSRKLLKKHYKQINGIIKNYIIFGCSDQANKKSKHIKYL